MPSQPSHYCNSQIVIIYKTTQLAAWYHLRSIQLPKVAVPLLSTRIRTHVAMVRDFSMMTRIFIGSQHDARRCVALRFNLWTPSVVLALHCVANTRIGSISILRCVCCVQRNAASCVILWTNPDKCLTKTTNFWALQSQHAHTVSVCTCIIFTVLKN